MSAPLVLRCFHHPLREAAARCPACRRPFCRECVTEHEDRVLCASCLAATLAPARARRRGAFGAPLATASGFLAAWLFFFLLGRLLAALPSAVAEEAAFGDPPAGAEAR